MERYYTRSGKPSGVTGYEIGTDYIIVRLNNGFTYRYSDASCGAENVQNMIACAKDQSGLHTYIQRNDLGYDWKR